MNEVNLTPSLLAAHLATKFLTGYALAKTGVHYIATALA